MELFSCSANPWGQQNKLVWYCPAITGGLSDSSKWRGGPAEEDPFAPAQCSVKGFLVQSEGRRHDLRWSAQRIIQHPAHAGGAHALARQRRGARPCARSFLLHRLRLSLLKIHPSAAVGRIHRLLTSRAKQANPQASYPCTHPGPLRIHTQMVGRRIGFCQMMALTSTTPGRLRPPSVGSALLGRWLCGLNRPSIPGSLPAAAGAGRGHDSLK